MIKRLISLIVFALCLYGCTADYETFGTSDYNDFSEIAFDNQDGDVAVYTEEHKIVITMEEPPESLSTWKSVTITSISTSHFAEIHLVESKFREFPSDSAALDSLANVLAYSEKTIGVGDKIEIPASLAVYVMVVSESGKPALWKLEFNIPGVEPVSSVSESEATSGSSLAVGSSADGVSSSGVIESIGAESSSSIDIFDISSSSVEVVLDSNVSFNIYFENALETETSNDTVYVTFAKGTDLKNIALDTTKEFVYRKSSVSPNPKEEKDWTQPVSFNVTAECGITKTWVVVVNRLLDDEKHLQVRFENQFSVGYSDSQDTIYVKLNADQSYETAKLNAYSGGVTVNPLPDTVKKWQEYQTFTVTAEDGTMQKWVVAISFADPDEKPASTEHSLVEIGAKDEVLPASVDSVEREVVLHMASDSARGSIELSKFIISGNASSTLKSSLDLRTPQKFTITAEDGVSFAEWTISADYVKSSAAEVLSYELDANANGFSAEVKIDASAHKISFDVPYKNRTSLSALAFDAEYSAKATASVKVSMALSGTESVNGYVAAGVITVTAEDGTDIEWTVQANVLAASSEANIIFGLDNSKNSFTGSVVMDTVNHKITISVSEGTDLSNVAFRYICSDGAAVTSPEGSVLNLSSKSGSIVVTAENGTAVTWNVVVEEIMLLPPRITSMKIAGQTAIVDSVQEDGQWFRWVHYDDLTFLADLTKLTVSDIQLTTGATITGVTDGSSYDLSYGQKVTVSNGTESVDYEIRAGYQYPNSDFETWSKNKPESWDNGNQNSGLAKVIMTEQKDLGSYGKAVQMSSKTVAGFTFASGNLFIGTFNPKGVSQLGMLGYDDGNELIDFGKPFNARPRYMEIDIKYTKEENDSCDVYIFLENRTATGTCTYGNTAGSNVCRGSSDKNTLVASAWYRSTSDNDTSDPDVVSISEPNSAGLRTLRLKLKYGTPYDASPIKNDCKSNTSKACVSALSTIGLVNSKGIDNHFNSVDGTLPVTHIRAVFAASADGNHYEGSEGSQLIVDNFRLIY